LFFQFDIDERFQLPFKTGSHLSMFMCIKHDEPTNPPLWPSHTGKLPDNYWDCGEEGEVGHYQLIMNLPNSTEQVLDIEERVILSSIKFEEEEEQITVCGPEGKTWEIGKQEFKVGGIPSWAQNPEQYQCSCGAEMKFICQIPQDFDFPKKPDAPNQKSTWSDKKYNLFLGNEVYIFGCSEQCNPNAVWPITQSD
jgi:hypothetical protein